MGGQIITRVLVSVIFLSWTQGEETILKHYTSTYGLICYDSCRKEGKDYYWCKTKKGWDYCSITENTDYKGNECTDKDPCDKYGENYYWCKLKIGGWNYCGQVKPSTVLYISSTYQSECRDDCSYEESQSYSWCNTDEGWDYCSVTHDVTYKSEPCRPDHPCDAHKYSYFWCKTASSWDYCGLVDTEGICSTITRRKRQSEDNDEICLIDRGNKKVTKITIEPNSNAIAEGRRWRNEIINIISRWNNNYLSNQARSEIITTENLRIDIQGLVNRFNQPYYNLQIQINTARQRGRSTTVAQVLIPQNEEVPDRYVRRAFTESFCRRARVIVDVTNSNLPDRHGQNCDLK